MGQHKSASASISASACGLPRNQTVAIQRTKQYYVSDFCTCSKTDFIMFVRNILTLVALALLTGASAVSNDYTVHEKRSSAPMGWRKREPLGSKAMLPISIGLAQQNLEKGYDWLMQVSHSSSSKYGQHWNASDVAFAFAPRFVVEFVQ
jgi:hypothetical protein